MSGIFFSATVNTELVAIPVILGILSSVINFTIKICFLTKLLTSGISFSTAVNAKLVATPVILGILFSIAVNSDLLAKLLTLGILFSTSVILELKTVVKRKRQN